MNKSPEIKNLAGALAKFQKAMVTITRDAENPFFKSKYADFASLVEAIRQPLADNGLSFSQFPTGDGGLTTILLHESGEWIEDTFTLTPVDRKPQSVGSAITYARRYALGAVLGLATEADDDGNAANGARPSQATAQRPKGDEAAFASLMKMVKTSDAKALAELGGKMAKSDKYTQEQKERFAEAAEERMRDLGTK